MVSASERGLTAQIAIVGGGLSGLYAAALLGKHGLTDYLLLEASPSFGGRIDSVPPAPASLGERGDAQESRGRFDLGATWFWPRLQPQLGRIFGPEAAAPKVEFVKDWARTPFTATAADLHAVAGHSHAPSPVAASGDWRDRITGIASEWSPEFPGYVAGAIDAASRGVARLAPHVRAEASRRQAEESH
ncbi:hypothetical protein D3C87_1463640 [compost metagenome]